jgi:Leucine-rich repeat (LRR) protein
MLYKIALQVLLIFPLLLIGTSTGAAPMVAPDPAEKDPAPPKFADFNFATKAPVAEILYAVRQPPVDGKLAVKWGRVLAQGKVRLPTNCDLQINLRFDGLEQMAQLNQLSGCKVAGFVASDLDFEDRMVPYLKQFKTLRLIDLSDTLVTDECLPLLGSLPRLRTLNLVKTNVTGAGFSNLDRLHNLANLCIEGTSLQPGAIFKLKPILPDLLLLRLARTGLTKADARALQDLKKIELLTVSSNSKIDNDCVKYLGGLKRLKTLDISDTAISDKSIPELLKLPALRDVRVRGKSFWKTRVHKSSYGMVNFNDIADFSDAPSEVFMPLH